MEIVVHEWSAGECENFVACVVNNVNNINDPRARTISIIFLFIID